MDHAAFRTGAPRRRPWATLALALAAIGLYVVPGAGVTCEYQRDAVASGQFWRLVTCHWTHYSSSHLFWDVLVFAVLGVVCELKDRVSLLAGVGTAVAAISAAVGYGLPHLQGYRGLSGIDSALFIMAAGYLSIDGFGRGRGVWAAVTLAMLVVSFLGKTAYESATGRALFVESAPAEMVPVPLAHLVGAGVGLLTLLCRLRFTSIDGDLGVGAPSPIILPQGPSGGTTPLPTLRSFPNEAHHELDLAAAARPVRCSPGAGGT